MKTSFNLVALACLLASSQAFAPMATRAVGKKPVAKKAPVVAKKAPVVAKKASFFAKKDPVVAKKAPVVAKKASFFAKKDPVVAKKAPVKKAPVKKAPVKKAPVKIVKKIVAKKAPVKKIVAKKAPVKKAPVKKVVKKVARGAPSIKSAVEKVDGYPSFSAATASWKPFAGISGGGNKAPVNKILPADFSDPKLQIVRDPAFYAAAALTRGLAKQTYVIDDGLTVIERNQRKTIPTFLTGSAKSQVDASSIRNDIVADEFAFGLDADRFQLVFIAVFGIFTLLGSLSGALEL